MKVRLALATVLLGAALACGSSSSSPAAPSPTPSGSTGTQVSIVSGATSRGSSAYAPNPVTVAVGGTVTWTNNDTVAHTSTGDNNTWDSGTIAAGGTFSRTFTTAGSFPYHCAFHPGMVGTVTVQ